MKHLYLIIMCLATIGASAQRLTRDFNGTSLAEALIWIDSVQSEKKLNFIFDELEDFTVTTRLRNATATEAVRQVTGFYPVRIVTDGNDIYVECTHKEATKLSGRIIDEAGQPVPYANIALLTVPKGAGSTPNPTGEQADSAVFLTGGVSNEAGDFVIPCGAPRVIARISCIGYKTVERETAVTNIGTIQLAAETYNLKTVNVKGTKRLYTATERGILANVQGTPLEQFGMVSEMLRHLPLMMADGTVVGRGKPEIYVNNKKIRNMDELNRLRADEILSAEIITTPGAEYGAEVRSVIRLKTIRRAGEGLSGNFSAAYRQGEAHYANLNAALNYRLKNGMDFFARGYLTENATLITAESSDQLIASSTWDYERDGEWRAKTRYLFADLGWNWDISDRHSVGFTYTAFCYLGALKNTHTSDEQVWRDGERVDGGHSISTTRDKPHLHNSVNAYYVGEIGKWKLDFGADWHAEKHEYEMTGETEASGGDIIGSQTDTKSRLVAEKFVVTAPVPTGSLTFGEEASNLSRTSDFQQSGFSADNHVSQHTTTWSLFANYALTFGKYSLNAGLRWQNEYNDYETDGIRNDEVSRNYHVLIPRASVSYRSEAWSHTLAYSTYRYNPSYGNMSSAVNYRSKYEYDMGNPYLQPQTNYAVSWSSNWKWIYFQAEYQYIKNTITSFQSAYDDENHPGVMLMDYRNMPRRQIYGITLTFTPKVGCWQMNNSANFFFDDSDYEAMGCTHVWNGLCTTFSLDNTFTLPHDWLLNVSGDLRPYTQSGCAQVKTSGGMDFRISRQFLKDKSLSVALKATDLLRTRYIKMTAYGGINTRTQFREYRDAQRIGLDISWKFNATRSRYKGSHAGQSERNRL
ncbi:MAG: outer membrane beta-barrel protein [Prevotella sp.]|nr:outer membrane beta-barrel protein [Prevotella sp.]